MIIHLCEQNGKGATSVSARVKGENGRGEAKTTHGDILQFMYSNSSSNNNCTGPESDTAGRRKENRQSRSEELTASPRRRLYYYYARDAIALLQPIATVAAVHPQNRSPCVASSPSIHTYICMYIYFVSTPV